ncbi:cation:dicarboxylase symporter family transporter [Kingella kingae]|uniref:cation:dicarboxylate symporter family transporter n=1 Tax=Kingella kingae TaxID=504 RepID=UPI00254B597A|nr:cation:dicarboxylase symporter family transporter [Kingella kingae]MDK4594629.1 cation:dicarboxylase symporter family transporter [Kingella kingae]
MLNIDPSELNPHTPIKKQKFYQILYVQVVFAIVLGILLGHFFPQTGEAMKPLGDAFIKIVKMIIAPVIFLTVVTGIAGMTNMKKVGRVAGKAFVYFIIFSTLALIVGMVIANVIQPGAGLNIDPHTLDSSKVEGYVAKSKDATVVNFLMNIIPTTIVSPLTEGNILQVLFVAILFGVAVAKYNGFSIIKLIKYIKDELWLVLGTSSSEAALPTLMHKMEQAGCEKSVVGLVIPTGYSFNLDGTNIYMTMAALFIAQAVGIDLSWGEQFSLLLVAMLSSKGAAGVTGAGFITLAATLSVVPSVPVAGMALILGIDRFMSECRALTNLVGNACATIVVARWENALDKEQLDKALNRQEKP